MKTNSILKFRNSRAFTLIELLVVVVIISILASLLLSVIGKAKGKAPAIACLSNLKQLQLAWYAYVQDNSDSFPPNISRKIGGWDPFNVVVDGRVPWVLGNAQLDTNTASVKAGALFVYLDSPSLFHCPADKSTVRSQPRNQRTRSYSMHNWLNCDVISYGAVDGANDMQENLRKYSSLIDPGPSRTWVFIDEHQKSIDDGIFALGLRGAAGRGDFWISYPGDQHNNGVNLSYADGHGELHTWGARRKVIYTGAKQFIRKDDTANLKDLHWLQDRIPHALD